MGAGARSAAGPVTGTVAEFDEARGLGTIDGDDGATYAFHCISIADGTRSIDAGQRVVFDRSPRLGRIEATRVVKA